MQGFEKAVNSTGIETFLHDAHPGHYQAGGHHQPKQVSGAGAAQAPGQDKGQGITQPQQAGAGGGKGIDRKGQQGAGPGDVRGQEVQLPQVVDGFGHQLDQLAGQGNKLHPGPGDEPQQAPQPPRCRHGLGALGFGWPPQGEKKGHQDANLKQAKGPGIDRPEHQGREKKTQPPGEPGRPGGWGVCSCQSHLKGKRFARSASIVAQALGQGKRAGRVLRLERRCLAR